MLRRYMHPRTKVKAREPELGDGQPIAIEQKQSSHTKLAKALDFKMPTLKLDLGAETHAPRHDGARLWLGPMRSVTCP